MFLKIRVNENLNYQVKVKVFIYNLSLLALRIKHVIKGLLEVTAANPSLKTTGAFTHS
jgi:hypothetical protein